MFEEWMFEKKFLQQVSKHYKTNKPLPEELINKMVSLKNFNVGIATQQQIIYTLISLNFFSSSWNSSESLYNISRNLNEHHLPFFPYEPESHMFYSFGHLSGYGSKYYSYLWAKVLIATQ
jgi:Zn-dependent oligopeptidase